MIQGYVVEEGRLRAVPAPLEALTGVIWIDLLDPTDDEERAVETALGLEVPTREEMAEIEDSSRLYAENGAVVMTANLPVGAETEEPMLAPVTFILIGDRLVTLRYHEPRAFKVLPQRAERLDLGCSDGLSVLLSLLEVIVDRLADILETIGREVDRLSRAIFRPTEAADYQAVLRGLGRQGDLVAHTQRQPGLARAAVRVRDGGGRQLAGQQGRQGAAEDARARHALPDRARGVAERRSSTSCSTPRSG